MDIYITRQHAILAKAQSGALLVRAKSRFETLHLKLLALLVLEPELALRHLLACKELRQFRVYLVWFLKESERWGHCCKPTSISADRAHTTIFGHGYKILHLAVLHSLGNRGLPFCANDVLTNANGHSTSSEFREVCQHAQRMLSFDARTGAWQE